MGHKHTEKGLCLGAGYPYIISVTHILIYVFCFVLVLPLAGRAFAAPGPVPAPWRNEDIGSPLMTGNATYDPDTGEFVITAGGKDIWGSSDQFHFVHQTFWGGNCVLIAQVVSFPNAGNNWQKAGVMFRQDTTVGSQFCNQVITGGDGGGEAFQWRKVADSGCGSSNVHSGVAPPQWVKLCRYGDLFFAYFAPDNGGTPGQWVQEGGYQTIQMTDLVEVGLCVTSCSSDVLATATIDNWEFIPEYREAIFPNPPDEALNVSVDANLSWSPGDNVDKHKVLFGEFDQLMSPGDEITPEGGQDANTIDPNATGLEYGTKYFWRVIEVNDTNSYAGPVWSFMTESNTTGIAEPNLIAHYEFNGDGNDSSGYGHHGTLNNGPVFAESWCQTGTGQAIDFEYDDGTSVEIAPFEVFSHELTIACWMKLESLSRNDGRIVAKGYGTGEQDYSWQFGTNSNRRLLACIKINDNVNTRHTGNNVWEFDKWHHVAMRYNGSNVRMYVDAVQVHNWNVTGPRTLDYDLTIPVAIGNHPVTGDRALDGLVDDVRIYDYAMDAAELAQLMKVHYTAEPMYPPDDEENTSLDMTLQWTAGDFAEWHDIYFSDDFNEVNERSGAAYIDEKDLGEETKSIVGLTPGTKYFWAVDEGSNDPCVPPGMPWKSKVWSFTTMPLEAYAPDPADGQACVAPDVTLKWQKGGTLPNLTGYHHIFIGESSAAVDAMVTPTATQRAFDMDYGPLALEYEKTYYWRVDEVNAPGGPFKGDVWSFTTRYAIQGSITWERWYGMTGISLDTLKNDPRYPDSPDYISELTLFDTGNRPFQGTPQDENYGSRIHSWLFPPVTGDYKFWITTDDQGELWLSTDKDPANVQKIAYCGNELPQGGGGAGYNGWTEYAAQKSAPVHLEAGKIYYIMALYKEGGGGDHCRVGWQGPTFPAEHTIIDGQYLSPYRPVAVNLSPSDGKIEVPTTGNTFSWDPGIDDSTMARYGTQKVYFGQDPCSLDLIGTVTTGPNEQPLTAEEPLDFLGVYYWQIVGVNDSAVEYPSPIWKFKVIYDDTQTEPNFLGHWKFDNDANDSSGYGRDGTEYGDPTYGVGIIDQAIDLDGLDDYVEVQQLVQDDFTIAFWVKTTQTGGTGQWRAGVGLVDAEVAGVTSDFGTALIGGNFGFGMGQPDTTVISTTNINDNSWHHVAATRVASSGLMEVYVDGVQENFTTGPSEPRIAPPRMTIGMLQTGVSGRYLDGLIDDVRVYGYAKSDVEIYKLYRINLAWAYDPNPYNGETDVVRDPNLNWSPGDYAPAGLHRVNFGDDPCTMSVIGTPDINTIDPGALDLGKTYYWRVDEQNGAGWDIGREWSFTVTNYFVVDDMESYTPRTISDNDIFEVWVDDTGRGAASGDGSMVSLAETIAADGNSMRFDFNDTVVSLGYLSKAKAEVANLPSGIGPDWTAGGVKALTLSFRGVQGNGLEPMWVELGDTDGNSTTVTYGDHLGEDLNDVNDEAWHEWNIDLQDFNTGGTAVNLSSVNDITIGFGDGTPGGGGPPPPVFPDVPDPYTVYFDDIRLYAARCVLDKRDPCFARVDYVTIPGAGCAVDDRELDVMFGDWLEYDEIFDSEPVGDTNLMARYEFELNFDDSSLQANDGAEIGGPLDFSADRMMGEFSLDLDGTDDCVDCGYDASLSMRDKITVACWVKSGDFGLNKAPFVSYRGEGGRGWQLRRHSFNNEACFTVRGTTGDDDPRGNTNVQDDEWHHIAGTYDGVSRYLYVDGVVEPRGSIADDTGLIGNFNNNDEVAIGARTQNNERGKGNFEAFVNALIDDVRIYNIALTQGQIITCMGLPEVYVEVTSPANVYDKEPKNSKEVNFRDYALVAERFLDEDMFPPEGPDD